MAYADSTSTGTADMHQHALFTHVFLEHLWICHKLSANLGSSGGQRKAWADTSTFNAVAKVCLHRSGFAARVEKAAHAPGTMEKTVTGETALSSDGKHKLAVSGEEMWQPSSSGTGVGSSCVASQLPLVLVFIHVEKTPRTGKECYSYRFVHSD